MVWNRMNNDVEWRYFLESLWHYQYIQIPSELTDELAQTLYFESQGIADIAIKLYFLAQMSAIVRKEEGITRELLHMAAKQSLRLVQPFLGYLRANNTKKIQKEEHFSSRDIEGEFQRASNEVSTAL